MNIKHGILLSTGIGLAGLTCGYLVGASNTPVVGAALPILGGVVMVGLAVYQTKGIVEGVSALKDLPAEERGKLAKDILAAHHLNPLRVGVALTVFFIAMMTGILTGSYVRNSTLFLPKASQLEPVWTHSGSNYRSQADALLAMKLYSDLRRGGIPEHAALALLKLPEQSRPKDEGKKPSAPLWKTMEQKPASAEEAVKWLNLQHAMEEQGYDKAEIQFILSLPGPVPQIDTRNTKPAPTPAGGDVPTWYNPDMFKPGLLNRGTPIAFDPELIKLLEGFRHERAG